MPENESDLAPASDLIGHLQRLIHEEIKHKPLEQRRLEMAKRLRLIPVASGISDRDEIVKAKDEFHVLEQYFTQWRRDLEFASLQHDNRSPDDLLNDDIREARTSFVEQGGLSAMHTVPQIDFALSNGILMKIALELREGLSVTVGGVLMLTRSSDYQNVDAERRDYDQQELFPLYDLAQTQMPPFSTPAHTKTAVTLRSILLPHIDDAIRLGFVDSNDVPDDLRMFDLRHLGLPAAAKGALVEVFRHSEVDKDNPRTTTLRSHIGEIFPEGRADLKAGNQLGRGFNDWMQTVGSVLETVLLDTHSKLRLSFRVLMADIDQAREALLGPKGIASGKGHDVSMIEAVGNKTAERLMIAINNGEHAEI